MTLGPSPTSEDAFRSGASFCRERVPERSIANVLAPLAAWSELVVAGEATAVELMQPGPASAAAVKLV